MSAAFLFLHVGATLLFLRQPKTYDHLRKERTCVIHHYHLDSAHLKAHTRAGAATVQSTRTRSKRKALHLSRMQLFSLYKVFCSMRYFGDFVFWRYYDTPHKLKAKTPFDALQEFRAY